MPIEALPPTTIRAIGSTSVISDPCSVVKELVDNALDAAASSLFIEITSNTVDVISLRDNGHGIPAEDHTNVCKHAFTSKIQTVEDLRNVGGSSFGFRGEALASIAEMSSAVTVTTRVASDVVGSCLKYGRDGTLSQYVFSNVYIIVRPACANRTQITANITPSGDDCSNNRFFEAPSC